MSEVMQDSGYEVGVIGGELPFWLAGEALRQAEFQLTEQQRALDGLIARATALLGWSVSITLALAALATTGRLIVPAVTAATMIFGAAVLCVWAVLPKWWSYGGHNAKWLIDQPYPTQLEVMQAMALGSADGAHQNSVALSRFGWKLRFAWALFVATPPAALLAHVATA